MEQMDAEMLLLLESIEYAISRQEYVVAFEVTAYLQRMLVKAMEKESPGLRLMHREVRK